jgi:hypothetical protein
MALFRCLVSVVLVSATAAGCSQSLFNDGSGDDPGGRDGGPQPIPPDARPGEPDAGEDNRPDAGDPGEPDAGVSPDAGPSCTPPCLSDAYTDFALNQGGTNGRWRYVEFQAELPTGQEYVDMAMDPVGWLGTGYPAPSLSKCDEAGPQQICYELLGMLGLRTPVVDLGSHFPGLMWTAPAEGTYQIAGTLKVAPNAPVTLLSLSIGRNDGSPPVFSSMLTATTDGVPFQVPAVQLGPGDDIVLNLKAVQETINVGLTMFITLDGSRRGSW